MRYVYVYACMLAMLCFSVHTDASKKTDINTETSVQLVLSLSGSSSNLSSLCASDLEIVTMTEEKSQWLNGVPRENVDSVLSASNDAGPHLFAKFERPADPKALTIIIFDNEGKMPVPVYTATVRYDRKMRIKEIILDGTQWGC